MNDLTERRDVPAWIWLWLPPLMIAAAYGLRIWSPCFYACFIDSERGIVEIGTVAVLVPAIGFAVQTWRRRERLPRAWLGVWVAAVGAGSLYFAGEELSWGQHLFQWETPAAFRELNDQSETNLHNLSSWLDQKPRLALELWVVTAGLLPAWRALTGARYGADDWRYWFWPTVVCVPAAALAFLIKLPERTKDVFDLPPFRVEVRYSELQEFYFALFLALYLASIYLRLRREPGSRKGAKDAEK